MDGRNQWMVSSVAVLPRASCGISSLVQLTISTPLLSSSSMLFFPRFARSDQRSLPRRSVALLSPQCLCQDVTVESPVSDGFSHLRFDRFLFCIRFDYRELCRHVIVYRSIKFPECLLFGSPFVVFLDYPSVSEKLVSLIVWGEFVDLARLMQERSESEPPSFMNFIIYGTIASYFARLAKNAKYATPQKATSCPCLECPCPSYSRSRLLFSPSSTAFRGQSWK